MHQTGIYISLIREFRTATDLPIAVYPNSGEEYDPVTKTWHGTNDKRTFYDYALSYFQNGATAVGGCCTTVESHIRQVTQARRDFEKGGDYSENEKKWLKNLLQFQKNSIIVTTNK